MTKTLVDIDQEFIWHPYTQAHTAKAPLAIKQAKGAYLLCEDGKKVFDGISSWWVNTHGHCHPHINQAIARQAEILEHVIFAGFTHEPAVRLAQQLVELAPPGLRRVFYSDNGSTAVEVAIKMAYQYWQNKGKEKPHFIALEHSFHGETFGCMSVAERSVFTKPFWPLLFNVLTTKSPCISDVSAAISEEELTHNALQHLEDLFLLTKGQVAGLIIEPMLQGAGGMRMFTKGFFAGVANLCKKYDALLIADEVACAFYRTGKLFACEHERVLPDIMCLAKGLTGGYLPLSATLATQDVYQAFLSDKKSGALLHGHSFTANPLGCAAAMASLELFEREQTQENIKNIAQVVQTRILEFSGLPGIKNARAIGTTSAIELLDSDGGYLSHATHKISERCFEHGLFIRPLGNVIYLMPPLCSTPTEINWAFDVIKNAILQS